MTKKKNKKQEDIPKEVKPYQIIGAVLVDGVCNYSMEIMTGPTAGEKHNVKGKNVIHDDLRNAFLTLNRHLASMDGAYKDVEHTNIDQLENNIITSQYDVHGFKVSGNEEDEKIELEGSKYSNEVKNWFMIKTGKVALDHLGTYTWYNELKEASANVRSEVEQYMAGKSAPKEEESEVVNRKQTKMFTENDPDFDSQLEQAEL